LFDSLYVPDQNALKGLAPRDDEAPFYCLLEDDVLVTSLQVKTERLLSPLPERDGKTPESNVELLIAVSVRPTSIHLGNVGFLGD
jgi:hypothetical protein